MLISFEELKKIIDEYNIIITGVLHIGAHECEELTLYQKLGLSDNDMLWMEALEDKVQQAKLRGVKNIFQVVVFDQDDQSLKFNVSNNIQSSSLLEFGTHIQEHPDVYFTKSIEVNTITIDTFFKKTGIDQSKYNMWNLDIQGVELHALKGGVESLVKANVKLIYCEVNIAKLYKDCTFIDDLDKFLDRFGFKRVLTRMTHHGWGDAIYVCSNSIE